MHIIRLDTVDSTNTYLKRNYQSLESGTFVSALLQTAGKGRNDRKWIAAKGENLTFSLLLKDEFFYENYRSLSVLSAYCVLKALERLGVRDLSIKWPNDVYAGGKKICGILLESVIQQKMECLIIGIGINLNQKCFEGDYLRTPTSAALQLGKDVDLELFADGVFSIITDNLSLLRQGHDFHPQIEEYDYLAGKMMYAEINGCRREVEVCGIDSDFSLKVIEKGEYRNIDAGEMTFHL
ncbi:MAG: biotin--[Erysipelotrichaceae bacterium]|nr:biotin--[acetyl-CoA-carboxylase] ligase [Erysipelotrichaceae bacterium]